MDGFILSNYFDYTQEAVDLIRETKLYTPIIVYTTNLYKIDNVNIHQQLSPQEEDEFLFDITIENINSFNKLFDQLQKLTIHHTDIIKFGDCEYEPAKKILSGDWGSIQFTNKQGLILEILVLNYEHIVHKDILSEKIWGSVDYYVSRSMDVHISKLKKIINSETTLTLKNIIGSGLILE
jgi:hypothetical protein